MLCYAQFMVSDAWRRHPSQQRTLSTAGDPQHNTDTAIFLFPWQQTAAYSTNLLSTAQHPADGLNWPTENRLMVTSVWPWQNQHMQHYRLRWQA